MSGIEDPTTDLSWREKARALIQVARFRPELVGVILALSLVAAVLEGFGLSFILPIVEVAQSDGVPPDASGLLGAFVRIYDLLGVRFTLEYLIVGVIAVMTVRFVSSFLLSWFRAAIVTQYTKYLQEQAFDNALDARVSYFDSRGSDDILNVIVTQAEYAGYVIRYVIRILEQGLLVVAYLVVALYLAPVLTLVTAVVLGGLTFLFRNLLDRGYILGDEVADAKEKIQSSAQAGTLGIRDVKLFGMAEEIRSGFVESVVQFERNRIKIFRNSAAITNFYQLATAVMVFVLVYLALTAASLSFGELGVFLFAMFRLGPKVSSLNSQLYNLEGYLPHLIRTQAFIEELERNHEDDGGSAPVPTPVGEVAFDDVDFTYESNEGTALHGVTFSVDPGEFVAFVGPSGAGKSTIASLLARMYEPDRGEITADDIPIDEFDVDEWRSHVTVVRQDPHIFNNTLRWNVTVGNREASEREVERACEIAQVSEFDSDLPNGYDTVLGDHGVKLSGGQRQRVAIARALLKDADLLILDEATSDLDTSLEQRVHRGIEAMDRDYAMLVIAHRLSTVTNADQIYAMEDGEIVEVGDHDRLMSEGGIYAELYSMQS